jgi:5'-nucleotidase (lipoprotein e(P4) family)
MRKQTLLLLIVALPFINSCKNSNAFSSKNGEEPVITSHEHSTMAVLYQQTAAEYRALCYQAFNIAKIRVDESSKMLGGLKKPAIVVDIDETMLDNSPYEAKCILDNIAYPEKWDEWMNASNAQPVPGALDFLKYAESKKIDVFYITNRKEKYREQTLKNLQKFGFPNATNEYLMLRGEESSKQTRREKVNSSHFIIMLIGDNLNDFSEVFEQKKIEERFALTDEMQRDFGKRFIVLPNAMYGDWEGVLYNYDNSLDGFRKSEMRHRNLKGF